MKNTRLTDIEKLISDMKNEKKIDKKIVDKIIFDLDQEEIISRNYLIITQKDLSSQNKKKALAWNKEVINLKEELNSILKDVFIEEK